MSAPRGNTCQRRLIEVAHEVFAGSGFLLKVNRTRGGGHARLHITRPKHFGGGTITMHIASTPRDEGNALTFMRQSCMRILRGQR